MEVVVAKIEDLESGSSLAVSAGNLELVLFRHADGSFSALKDCCSHAEVSLSGGEFEDGIVQCPAHGARFDARTGKHLCMPAVKGVQKFEVLVKGQDVIVVVPE